MYFLYRVYWPWNYLRDIYQHLWCNQIRWVKQIAISGIFPITHSCFLICLNFSSKARVESDIGPKHSDWQVSTLLTYICSVYFINNEMKIDFMHVHLVCDQQLSIRQVELTTVVYCMGNFCVFLLGIHLTCYGNLIEFLMKSINEIIKTV